MNKSHCLTPHGLFSLLSYTIQDGQPRDGNTHNGLGPPISIIDQENVPQAYLQAGHYDGSSSSIEDPSSHVTLTYA